MAPAIKPNSDSNSSAHEVVSTRRLAASRERVFQAFGDPVQLAQWWGPKGFTNTFQEFDLRPGGAWRFVMHGLDGANYPNEKKFIEVVRPERIVFDHIEHDHRFRMTMIFAEIGGKTELTWRMFFESAAQLAQARDFIVVANEENFDRLEAHLS